MAQPPTLLMILVCVFLIQSFEELAVVCALFYCVYIFFLFLILLCLYCLGLIEVTNLISENAAIRRVQLPTNCGEHIDKSVEFVVAGTGKTTFDTAVNGTKGLPLRPLRETRLTTMPYNLCRQLTNSKINVKSVICAVTSGGRSIACGDSGIISFFL